MGRYSTDRRFSDRGYKKVMRDLVLYPVVVLMGAVLGLSVGYAASSAKGRIDGVSPADRVIPEGALPSKYLEFTSPIVDSSQDSPASVYSNTSKAGAGVIRPSTDSSEPHHFPPSTTEEIAESKAVTGPKTLTSAAAGVAVTRSQPEIISPASGQLAGVAAPLFQSTLALQWTRLQSANALFTPLGDATRNGVVDVEDLALVALALGKLALQVEGLDLNGDGLIDHKDLEIVARNLGAGGP